MKGLTGIIFNDSPILWRIDIFAAIVLCYYEDDDTLLFYKESYSVSNITYGVSAGKGHKIKSIVTDVVKTFWIKISLSSN